MILHGVRAGSPVVTDTGCCQSAAPTAPTSTFETQPESPAHIIRLPELNQVKRDYWAVFDDIEQNGQAAVAEARRRAKQFIAKWTPLYPPRSPERPTTSTRSWSTCCSRPSTASASATPT